MTQQETQQNAAAQDSRTAERLLWECHCAAFDGSPVPFERWLADGGPAEMPQDVKELREAYDTISEHEHRLRDAIEGALGALGSAWDGQADSPMAAIAAGLQDALLVRLERLEADLDGGRTSRMSSKESDVDSRPGPIERKLRSRLRYRLFGTWGPDVVAERLARPYVPSESYKAMFCEIYEQAGMPVPPEYQREETTSA